jgi:hypothetical protein
MNDIKSTLSLYSIADSETISITTELERISLRILLWNGKTVIYRFIDWLYQMNCMTVYSDTVYEFRVLERSPLVIQMANEYYCGDQAVNQAIQDYVEIQIWSSDLKEHPAFVVVTAEAEIVECCDGEQ